MAFLLWSSQKAIGAPKLSPWLAFDKSMTVDGGQRLKRWQAVPRLKEGNKRSKSKESCFFHETFAMIIYDSWLQTDLIVRFCFILFLKVDLDIPGIWNCWCLPRRFGRLTPRRSTSRSLPIVFRHRKLLVVSITATWPRQGPKSTQIPAVSH